MPDPQQHPDDSLYFLPGEQLRIRDEWRRPAVPVHRRARAWAPARLHFNVIDFFQMRPMIPGAGGFGFSTTGAWSEVEVSLDDGGGEMPATARHLCRLFGEMVGYPGDQVSVRVPTRIRHVHGGFGIMLDDVLAAMLAWLALQIGAWYFGQSVLLQQLV